VHGSLKSTSERFAELIACHEQTLTCGCARIVKFSLFDVWSITREFVVAVYFELSLFRYFVQRIYALIGSFRPALNSEIVPHCASSCVIEKEEQHGPSRV
jgi:hypothetical protein